MKKACRQNCRQAEMITRYAFRYRSVPVTVDVNVSASTPLPVSGDVAVILGWRHFPVPSHPGITATALIKPETFDPDCVGLGSLINYFALGRRWWWRTFDYFLRRRSGFGSVNSSAFVVGLITHRPARNRTDRTADEGSVQSVAVTAVIPDHCAGNCTERAPSHRTLLGIGSRADTTGTEEN